MWQGYELPMIAEIEEMKLDMRTDFRAVLDILKAMNDPDLSLHEQICCSLTIFYPQYPNVGDINKAVEIMNLFISGNEERDATDKELRLVDWEQDISIIIPPINRILGQEIRQLPYLHWWTFLGAFAEIGECTFNTFVGIRAKKAKGKKLEKYENDIYKENRKKIDIKQKLDSSTKALIDDVLSVD